MERRRRDARYSADKPTWPLAGDFAPKRASNSTRLDSLALQATRRRLSGDSRRGLSGARHARRPKWKRGSSRATRAQVGERAYSPPRQLERGPAAACAAALLHKRAEVAIVFTLKSRLALGGANSNCSGGGGGDVIYERGARALSGRGKSLGGGDAKLARSLAREARTRSA